VAASRRGLSKDSAPNSRRCVLRVGFHPEVNSVVCTLLCRGLKSWIPIRIGLRPFGEGKEHLAIRRRAMGRLSSQVSQKAC
jgi:hypothetical protein